MTWTKPELKAISLSMEVTLDEARAQGDLAVDGSHVLRQQPLGEIPQGRSQCAFDAHVNSR